jgi:catechol 2,3-dioxygenase-like lactoylglutathione lyase family enzyme
MRLQHVSTLYPAGLQEDVRGFYGGILGLIEKQVPATLADRGLIWFEAGAGELELHFVPEDDWTEPHSARHVCLEVDDLEDARERVKRVGRFLREPTPIPNRPRFFCADPFGNLVELTTILGDYRR